MRRRCSAAWMSALVAALTLALPLVAAAGTGEGGAGVQSAAAPARAEAAEPARSGGLPITAVDLALLLGGAAAIVGLGSGSRRLLRVRA